MSRIWIRNSRDRDEDEIGPFETAKDAALARKALMVYGPRWLQWTIIDRTFDK